MPLSPITRSGKLVADIESAFKDELSFYRTNLVKCLPLKQDKIRYPLKHEMDKCFPNFEEEVGNLRPNLIFLLGKQVANYVLSKAHTDDLKLSDHFAYESFEMDDIRYVPIHHPSYILVYKRRFIEKYIEGIHLHMKQEVVISATQ